MAESTGKAGIGMTLQVASDTSPVTWATVGNVTQLSAGGVTVNVQDTTHLGSPDMYRERVPGLKTAEDWTGTVQFDPEDPTLDSSTGMRKFLEDRTLETFRVNMDAVFTGFGIEVDAYVTTLGNIEITPEGLATQSFTLTVKGKPREVSIA